jgi:hypothetical protein
MSATHQPRVRRVALPVRPMFENISQWIHAGNMKTGLYVLEKMVRQTDKAMGFACAKFNDYGNLKPAVCWMPISRLQTVKNDYYVNGPPTMYLVPDWLYQMKTEEGYEI